MSFAYGKLAQQKSDVSGQLDGGAVTKRSRAIAYAFLTVLGLGAISFFAQFFFARTEMLTHSKSFSDGDAVFWVAILTGCSLGLLMPIKWWKRLAYAVVFSIIFLGVVMMCTIGLDRYQEDRLFQKGKSTFKIEQFRIADLDRGKKGRRFAIVEHRNYPKTGRIPIDRDVYAMLESNRVELPKKDWRPIYDFGHCVNLRVEHNLNAARIRLDGHITSSRLNRCPREP